MTLKQTCPSALRRSWSPISREVVHHAVNEFMEALWEAIAIVLVISFLNLGLRAGLVVATSIPLVLAIVFVTMQAFGIDLQRISLGALIIALGLLVDDAMITIESMVSKVEQGWDNDQSGDIRLCLDGLSEAHRHPGHRAWLRAGRFRKEFGRRIHLHALRGRRDRRAHLLGRRRALHAAHRDDALVAEAQGESTREADACWLSIGARWSSPCVTPN